MYRTLALSLAFLIACGDEEDAGPTDADLTVVLERLAALEADRDALLTTVSTFEADRDSLAAGLSTVEADYL